ncbi:MAG: flagellar biosynthetic protein FliR [Candidatus Krumholzibacteriia bacterium]
MAVNLDVTQLLVAAALTLRFGVVIATLPLLDLRAVPAVWRLALAGVLGAALAPSVAATLPPGGVSITWASLAAEAARSLLVGVLLAFALNLAFTTVRYAGQIAGTQIGFAIVNSFDPQSGAQISVLSHLYYMLAVLLFFAVDAHHVLITALYRTGTDLPLFAPLDPAAGAWLLVQDYGRVFTLGLRIAAPVVLVLLLVSATMGVIVKTVPQINVLVVGFPIKIATGLAVFGLSLVFFREVYLALLGGLDESLGRMILALR